MPNSPAPTARRQSIPARTPAEAAEEMAARLQRTIRLKVRYEKLALLCRPQCESFWVIGGRPGSYKTALQWNLALNAAEEDQRVLFVSLEMPVSSMALMALSKFSGIDRRRIEEHYAPRDRRPLPEAEQQKLIEAAGKFNALEKRMRLAGIETCGRNIGSVLEEACRVRYDGVFVDHLGMVGRGAGRELDVLAEVIDRLRALSQGEVSSGYRPWVCATSQLNREIDKSETERIPRLSDFRGSSRIEHDSDVAIGLRKRKGSDDSSPDTVEVHILKNRFGPCPSRVYYDAYGSTGLIVERREKEDAPPLKPPPEPEQGVITYEDPHDDP